MLEPQYTADMFLMGKPEIPREAHQRRNGSTVCGCGQTISANKTKCRACAEAENKPVTDRQGS